MPEQSAPGTLEMEQEPEAASPAVALAPDAAAPEDRPSHLDDFRNRIQELCDSDPVDFDAWVSLISSAEETSSDDIEVISLVYHRFLLEFPLCYGYWIKYAAHKARLCTNEDVAEVFKQAVQAVPHSVDLWVSYCGFGVCAYEDPVDIRSLFERALSLVEKDFLCNHLWDMFIEFETSQKQLIQLATIYINTLKFPTKKLHKYHESFRKLVTLLELESTHCITEKLSESIHTSEVADDEKSELDLSNVIANLFDKKSGPLRPKALKRYLSTGELLYQRSSKFYNEICCFEASIKRPFFHFKPLDDDQLENWHQYLDYVEKNGDFDWAVKLYERCLIPCANYSEFWIRYAEYVDGKGGREIANYALDRASSCFVKGVPTFCMYYAMFKEQIGDAPAARSLFVKARSNFTSGYYVNINRQANMEKRMGNIKAAYEIYETAIEDAMQKQNIEILPDLCGDFAQFVYMASHSIHEAKEVFVKGITRAHCKPLIKGLIQFMSTHGGPAEIPLLDSVISNAVTPGSDVSTALSPEDREDISLLFLEFVDLYGDVKELKKAWARHTILFPHSTRNISRQNCSTGNSLQENNKRRKLEPMMVAPDNSLEDIRNLKQSSKPDNFSLIADKEVESQVDRNTVHSGKGLRDAEEQKALENVDLHHESSRKAQECTEMVHRSHGLDKSEMQNQTNSHVKEVTGQDLTLCQQNDERTNFHQDQGEEAPVAETGGCDAPSIAIASSEKTNSLENIIEASPSSHPETVCSKYDLTSGASMPKDGNSSDPHQISPELEERQPVKVQVKLDMENDLSVNNANPERSDGGPDQTQSDKDLGHESQDHIESSQRKQLPVRAKSFSSELVKTEMNTVHCEAQLNHEVVNSRAHQFNNPSLAGQNMQQQWLSYTMPQNVQTSSQTQDQLFAQPNQGNQQYLQMTQGYASQMWQYYQQQIYFLQAHHNQQMQSLQQQQLPTEHLQQNFLQQVQQLNQQMVLWQQQVQQQQQQQQQLLQQALPVQQQLDDKQGQSSSVDTKHEQNKHQQQAPQMDNQSQQLQQQQFLYFQQQQQQMYLMQQQQQQQMYQQQQTQQQQLLQQHLMQQQQYLLQRPQQQEDSVQQQQQLFQQQQQQMLLLQQQQQQFIHQQMQQYAQQQQTRPDDQNYKLNPQDRSNWQMEHGQQSETSQSDGSKLRSGEQSELSYPSTPQSQRSNH